MRANSSSSGTAKARPRNSKRPALKPSGTSPASVESRRILEHRDLRVIWRAVEDLRPYERNPRRHPPKQIAKLATSIGEFGS